MAVGSVSFGNAQFQELVNKPQTYAKKPSGATGITGEKKKHTGVKIGVGLAAAAIALTAGLVAGAKTGVFNFEKLKNNEFVKTIYEKLNKPEKLKEFGKKALAQMDKIGNQIAEYGKSLLEKVKKLIPKAKETIQEASQDAGEAIQEAVS